MAKPLTKALKNGVIIPLSAAQLSLTHPIFLTSFGVYESIQVDHGKPFHLKDHLQRLRISANFLRMAIPQSTDLLFEWGMKLIQALPTTSYALQVLALGPKEADAGPTIVFFPRPLPTYPAHLYIAGAKAITYSGIRALPQAKSMNALVNHLARVSARQNGALEAILTHHNQLFEGARSNLFTLLTETRQLITPPAKKVLSGVTREVVINLMAETAHPIQEKDILKEGTPIAEMFITSTSMHVMPITQLNGVPVGDGSVGPITKEAMSIFETYYRRYLSRFPNFDS